MAEHCSTYSTDADVGVYASFDGDFIWTVISRGNTCRDILLVSSELEFEVFLFCCVHMYSLFHISFVYLFDLIRLLF